MTRTGFTLIELLVAVALAGMAFSLGIAGFVQTNNRSELTAATDQLISGLLETQKRTFAGEKPPAGTCTGTLLGYRLTFLSGAGSYIVSANCGGTFQDVETVPLAYGVTFTNSGCVRYETVRGTVSLFSNNTCTTTTIGPLSISLQHPTNLTQITSVTAAGVIDEGVIQ